MRALIATAVGLVTGAIALVRANAAPMQARVRCFGPNGLASSGT